MASQCVLSAESARTLSSLWAKSIGVTIEEGAVLAIRFRLSCPALLSAELTELEKTALAEAAVVRAAWPESFLNTSATSGEATALVAVWAAEYDVPLETASILALQFGLGLPIVDKEALEEKLAESEAAAAARSWADAVSAVASDVHEREAEREVAARGDAAVSKTAALALSSADEALARSESGKEALIKSLSSLSLEELRAALAKASIPGVGLSTSSRRV